LYYTIQKNYSVLQQYTTLYTTIQLYKTQLYNTFYTTLHNSTQLYTTLHNSAQLCTTLHNSAQLYTTLSKFDTPLHNFSKILHNFKALQDSQYFHNIRQHFTNQYSSLHNYTELYNILKLYKNVTTLHIYCTNIYNTLQYLTQLWYNLYKTYTKQLPHNFTQLYTPFHMFTTLSQYCITLHNFQILPHTTCTQLLHSFTQLCTTLIKNSLHNFTQHSMFRIPHNFATHYKTLQHSTIFTSLLQNNFTQLYTLLQHLTKLYNTFSKLYKSLQYFTTLFKTKPYNTLQHFT